MHIIINILVDITAWFIVCMIVLDLKAVTTVLTTPDLFPMPTTTIPSTCLTGLVPPPCGAALDFQLPHHPHLPMNDG